MSVKVKIDPVMGGAREDDANEQGGGGNAQGSGESGGDSHITSPSTNYMYRSKPPLWVITGTADGVYRDCWMAFDGILQLESSNCDSGHCWLALGNGSYLQAVKTSDFAVQTIEIVWFCKSGSRRPLHSDIAVSYDGSNWETIASNAEWVYDYWSATEICTGKISLGNTPLTVRGLRITAKDANGYNAIVWYDNAQ